MASRINAKTTLCGDEVFCPPLLTTCDTWEKAEKLAREALGFVLSDPHASSADRVKAAALILEHVRSDSGPAVVAAGSFEDWLAAQGPFSGESRL
jgi:hypothetical protein